MTAAVDSGLPLSAVLLASGHRDLPAKDSPRLAEEGAWPASDVLDAVFRVCDQVFVTTLLGDSPDESGLPGSVTVLADEAALQGPLGGLAGAMEAAEHEWVLAVDGQGGRLEPGVIGALWTARDSADVVAYAGPSGPEPLPALYRVSACLPAALEALATGRRRLSAVFSAVRVAEVPASGLSKIDPGLRSFVEGDASGAAVSEATVAQRKHLGMLSQTADVLPSGTRSAAPLRVDFVSGTTRGMPSERPVTIYLNDVEVATTQATPRDLEELAVGFLVSEGLLGDREVLHSVDADARAGAVHVTSDERVPEDFAYTTRYLTSGCGGGVTFSSVGHTRGLKPVTSELKVSADDLYALVGEMARETPLYRETGGMHACGLARGGVLEIVREDVGRHNALDKLLGRVWLDRIPTSDAVLISTGRISYEMAVKAAKAAVPIVASRSAVTDLAADVAGDLGITIIGYVRGGKITVYTHPERILSPEGD